MGGLCQAALWRTRRCARLPVPLHSPDRYCQQPARRLRRRAREFKWRDYRAKADNRYKLMTLDVDEFIRRFLIHVLPDGFHRIRHYGLFANGGRAENIARARRLLNVPAPQKAASNADGTGTVSRRHSRILVLAAAAGWSSLSSSNPGARRGVTRRFQIRSTAHDRHRPLTTLQCCSQLSLVVDRQRACSADDRSRAPAHSRGDGDRNSFIASPAPATASSGNRPPLAITTPTSQPIARGSQIPIAPGRRTVVPMPARGFLPRGLSDACHQARRTAK